MDLVCAETFLALEWKEALTRNLMQRQDRTRRARTIRVHLEA